MINEYQAFIAKSYTQIVLFCDFREDATLFKKNLSSGKISK